MTLELTYLADHPHFVPVVVRWMFDAWGHKRPDLDRDSFAARMEAQLNRTKVPIHVVAVRQADVVGVAILKRHEMEELFPDRQHWLGNVVVPARVRRQGIGTALCRRVIEIAASLGIPELHLQTERLDGGLYARLGFQPLQRVDYQGSQRLVMTLPLRAIR